MKRIYSISTYLIFVAVNAQVAIGKNEVNGNSTLLDFAETNNKLGIILPAVEDEDGVIITAENNGTFIFDKSVSKLKMYENGKWVSLSDAGSKTAIPNNPALEKGDGVIIGATDSAAEGVLILEADDKAMILPKIFRPHENVKNPYPGMMCYDTQSHSLAIFDGLNWNYWK